MKTLDIGAPNVGDFPIPELWCDPLPNEALILDAAALALPDGVFRAIAVD